MNKYIYIKNPIYPFKIHIFLGFDNIEKIKPYIKAKKKSNTKIIHDKIDEELKVNRLAFTDEILGHIIIVIKDFKGCIDCYDTLHHEITHAVDFSAEYIGIEQPTYIREYHAYLHGFITKEIYKKIWHQENRFTKEF